MYLSLKPRYPVYCTKCGEKLVWSDPTIVSYDAYSGKPSLFTKVLSCPNSRDVEFGDGHYYNTFTEED